MGETIEGSKNVNTAGLELLAEKELKAIMALFQGMGASPEKCEQIKNYLLTCLAEVRDERANSTESAHEVTNQDEEIYYNNFRANIKGIKNPNNMISLLAQLKKNGNLTTTKKEYGMIVSLDCLNDNIIIRNLGDVNFNSYNITERENRTDFTNKNTFETNKTGMMKISNDFSIGRVASKKDMQNILGALSSEYGLRSGRQGNIHDEDIAFFMLLTKCYGDFLLKDSVLKCYDDFRGFKPIRKNGTGQIIVLIKKRKL